MTAAFKAQAGGGILRLLSQDRLYPMVQLPFVDLGSWAPLRPLGHRLGKVTNPGQTAAAPARLQTGWWQRRPLKKQAESGENWKHFYDTKSIKGQTETLQPKNNQRTACACWEKDKLFGYLCTCLRGGQPAGLQSNARSQAMLVLLPAPRTGGVWRWSTAAWQRVWGQLSFLVHGRAAWDFWGGVQALVKKPHPDTKQSLKQQIKYLKCCPTEPYLE